MNDYGVMRIPWRRLPWVSAALILASIPCLVMLFHVPAAEAIALAVAFCLLLGAGFFLFLCWLILRPMFEARQRRFERKRTSDYEWAHMFDKRRR